MTRIVLVLALLVAGLASSRAATVSVVSMHYSAAQPVPHLHYDGDTQVGDVETLAGMIDTFVKCRIECLGPDGGSIAVLTLNGPGGVYGVGLALADYLRQNHIATVVERDAHCYSACAFAFLGGSGYSSMDSMGTYVDRQIEPGGIVGFHAPYRDEASFLAALEERGAGDVMTETRDSLSLMVKELVRWNVDPEIIHYMLGKGPDQTYDIVAADDYYLVRAALPPTPPSAWITDTQTAVRNACMRLLALDERADPLDYSGFFDLLLWQDDIGRDREGHTISGYSWNSRPLEIGSCGVPDAADGISGDSEVSLYLTPGIDGTISADTTFFNRSQGWSTAGRGHNPLKRVLQKGPMNHYWLPIGVPIDSLDLPGETAILENRFAASTSPAFGTMAPELEIASSGPGSRISSKGNVWVFERTGPRRLYDSALAAPRTGLALTTDAASDVGFTREGTYPDGTPFRWFGFLSGDQATVIRAFVVGDNSASPSDIDLATLREVQCGADFQGLRLGC